MNTVDRSGFERIKYDMIFIKTFGFARWLRSDSRIDYDNKEEVL
jgi:hypothetical protein